MTSSSEKIVGESELNSSLAMDADSETVEPKLSPMQDARNRLVSSAIGSAVAETLTLPTDVVKTRLQVQIQSSNMQYKGMFDCGSQIYKYEGFRGLFKGLQPALLRQVNYTGIAFVAFEPIRDTITTYSNRFFSQTSDNNTATTANNNNSNSDAGFVTRVLAGGTAGAFGITIMNPTEVLKTQLQSNKSNELLTMRQVVKQVYKTDGILGFWAGLKPNIARAFLVNAAEIGSYDHVKHLLIDNENYGNYFQKYNGFPAHITSSFAAAVLSATVSTPADVIKTRLMNQAGHNHEYKGMIDAAISIPRKEGFVALYKGFFPIITRKVLWCTAFFVTYEQVRAFLVQNA